MRTTRPPAPSGPGPGRKGEFAKAVADCSAAIRLDKDFAEAYRTRAAAYAGQKRYAAAIDDVTEAIRVEPKSADADCGPATTAPPATRRRPAPMRTPRRPSPAKAARPLRRESNRTRCRDRRRPGGASASA